ncbi:uncharacterized protein LOC111318173 [Durio zibethinus]|uniref:Uncharacterized protein LOC111318173 n=1 Tax=Durio zibethinus TaxID=66656 RepID=A0A6P6BHM1_DURZI|nr:uncharacterized protein LOC111318173 [Durio zibethinus]
MNQIEMDPEQHGVDDDQKKIPNGGGNGKVNGTAVSGDQDGGEFSDVEMEKSCEEKEEQHQDKEDSNPSSPDVSENHDTDAKEVNLNPQTNGNGHNHYIPAIKAQVHLPKPEPPPQPKAERSQSLSMAENMPSIGKYIRDRSSTFSAAIIKRLSSLKEDNGDFIVKNDSLNFEATEFKIPGVKVIVKLKGEDERQELKGRITFFTRSNCRDCTAVRKFFREKGLRYVEINIDVFPKRAKELVERTGSSEVPQIFFNEHLLGGLVTLNSLRNSGELDKRMKELLGQKCPEEAPDITAYGFDDEEEEEDELVGIVKVLRQSLPIQDRLIKMKIIKNCFAGADMVEAIIHHLDCGRRKGIETAKRLAQKHFIHHVFGENDFEEGKHFYRFLEHEPFIMGCFNFRTSTNDSEPKSASFLADRLTRLMSAILEAYASDDRLHVNYYAISKSEEFRRYLNLARDLQRVNLQSLTPDERLAFFLNLYNAMVIHAVISIGHPEGILDKRAFFCDFQYVVGGYPYSLSIIENGILRNNRKSPYSLIRPFSNGDRRLELAPTKVNPLIHFGLCNGTRSSPTVRFFTPQGVEGELRCATREYFQRGGIEINLDKRTVYLTRIIKWFSADFGQEKDVLKWVMSYLDATRSGLLTHLLADGGPINIVYQNYDWSGNL